MQLVKYYVCINSKENLSKSKPNTIVTETIGMSHLYIVTKVPNRQYSYFIQFAIVV